MKKKRVVRMIIPGALVVLSAWLIAGCYQPRQTAAPRQPSPGETPDPLVYQPAGEYEFLVDLEGTMGKFIEAQGEARDMEDEELAQMREEMAEVFEQLDISAEANQEMVRAHGEYRFDPGALGMPEDFINLSPTALLAQAGQAEILLPSHIREDRLVAHLFVANPDQLAMAGLEIIKEQLEEFSSKFGDAEISFFDLFLNAMGVEEASELTDWMGDEMVLMLLVNPNFDPERIPAMGKMALDEFFGNFPVCPLAAIASDDPERGLEIIADAVDFNMSMTGIDAEIERTELGGFGALMLPVEQIAAQMDFYFEEDKRDFVTMMTEVGPSVAVAAPGCVLIGARSSLEAALDALVTTGEPTGRTATMELGWNWDFFIHVYNTSFDKYAAEIRDTPEFEMLQDRFARLDEVVRGLDDLGGAHVSVTVKGEDAFDLDIQTSRDSITLVSFLIEFTKEASAMYAESMSEWDQEEEHPGMVEEMMDSEEDRMDSDDQADKRGPKEE